MKALDKVEVFDISQAFKFLVIYEELYTITMINVEVAAKCVLARDPLERVLIGQDIEGDAEIKELIHVLDIPNVSMLKSM